MRCGVYVHVPFCARKCDYCAFHSVPAGSPGAQRAIVGKIIRDSQEIASQLPLVAGTIYVGGGTPSVLPEGALAELLSGLLSSLVSQSDPPHEITCEANPESTTDEFLREARDAGVTRVSVGVQSLSPRLCREIGRIPTRPETLGRIRRTWQSSLAADLITGIPGQTTRDLVSDVDALSQFGFDHISVYDLSREPGTPLHARLGPENAHVAPEGPDWDTICETLESLGYERYEVSNFARPGSRSLHNLGYWRMHPYLGLGPSATSTLPIGSQTVRLRQSRDHGRYLRANPLRDASREVLAPDQLLTEFLMLGLRTAEGVNDDRFATLFGRELRELFGSQILPLVERGLLVHEPDSEGRLWLRATGDGMNLLNLVLARLFSES